MNHSRVRRRLGHRPHLEILEDRLPPGDALLGVLVGMAALPGAFAPTEVAREATASLSILSSNDVDALDAPSRPSQLVSTTVTYQPTRASTDWVDGVDTLEAAGTAR